MIDQFIAHIKKHIVLTAHEEQIILSAVEIRDLKKKEFLLQAGEICHDNYFIIIGLLRLYLITAKGAEQVIQFGIENWWITEYSSLKSGRPSQFYLQAVENSQVVVLKRNKEEALFAAVPQLEKYFRMVLEKAYAAQLNRIHYLFNLTGEELYLMMCDKYPEFIQRVPQYMLATFLGITPEFLSMLRARRK